MCQYNYQYRIDVDYNESFIMIQSANIHKISDYECIVTGSFVATESHHFIQFRAIPNHGGSHLSHPAINIYGHSKCCLCVFRTPNYIIHNYIYILYYIHVSMILYIPICIYTYVLPGTYER